jgi:hypothetical protein
MDDVIEPAWARSRTEIPHFRQGKVMEEVRIMTGRNGGPQHAERRRFWPWYMAGHNAGGDSRKRLQHRRSIRLRNDGRQ